jgi:hypothetical protein
MKIRVLPVVYLVMMTAAGWLAGQNKPYRVGTTACNFLEMGVGGAGNAMADAYVSVSRDLTAIYWNPAGLAYLNHNEVQFMYQPWISDTYIGFAGAAIVLPRLGTVGLGITNMDFGRTEVTTLDFQEGTGETYAAGEYAFSLSYARKLAEWFAFGAAAKWISSGIWHVSANAVALDLGVMVNTPFFSFTGNPAHGMNIGMSISNYGTKIRYDGIDLLTSIDILPEQHGNYKDLEGQYRLQGWELPLIFRIGASITPVVSDVHKWTLAVDALHPNNNNESINIGSEYQLNAFRAGRIFLRAGYKGLLMDESQYGATFGIGFQLALMRNQGVKVDYAYREVGLLGKSSVFSLGLTF